MSEAKEKLVESLVSNYDILDGFVVWGLEEGLSNVIYEIERLIEKKDLRDHQWQDLVDLCKDGRAFVHVLRYYTTSEYEAEMTVINKGIDMQKGWF